MQSSFCSSQIVRLTANKTLQLGLHLVNLTYEGNTQACTKEFPFPKSCCTIWGTYECIKQISSHCVCALFVAVVYSDRWLISCSFRVSAAGMSEWVLLWSQKCCHVDVFTFSPALCIFIWWLFSNQKCARHTLTLTASNKSVLLHFYQLLYVCCLWRSFKCCLPLPYMLIGFIRSAVLKESLPLRLSRWPWKCQCSGHCRRRGQWL